MEEYLRQIIAGYRAQFRKPTHGVVILKASNTPPRHAASSADDPLARL
jgi:hypothetical protein